MELNLGEEKIGNLIRRFSIPCVISMVVAALYNIVDQIFIGWSEAGAFGNAATNIVYPFTVLALGLALLIGDGAASGFSIALGQQAKKKADKNIGNGLIMLISISILLCITGFVFGKNILAMFGADPEEELCYKYANDYFLVICTGLPFYMIGQGLNGSIRADGSPRYAMCCTLAGAIANLILDPLFIFAFGMGVRGAAVATVIGQLLTFGMSIAYLRRPRQFTLSKDAIKPDPGIIGRIVSIGMASLIVQLSIVIIIAVNNNLLGKYGYETYASTGTAYGAVIPLAVVGIVMKVFGIVVSVVIGISLGGQPIIGFNLGAGRMDRVKETITVITKLILAVGTISFMVFEFIPDAVINLFGSKNTLEYMEYARLCIRIFLGGIILTCFIKSAAIMLQSMGNSFKSTLLALLRDVIIFVPASIILASISHSIVTMLWAAVISDVITAFIGLIFMRNTIRGLSEVDNYTKATDIADLAIKKVNSEF